MGSILKDFIALFFPSYCLGCSGGLVSGEEILCSKCLSDLPKTNDHFQLEESQIIRRLEGRMRLRRGHSFLKFQKGGMVQHLLHQLKYNSHPEIGIKLGIVFGHQLRDSGLNTMLDLIIPVPLHESRKRKRGYNQSAKFAEGLSQTLQVPWDESITVRKRNTTTQTAKSRAERWENVKDVFSTGNQDKILGKRILLVDDVITTGATLEACGQFLIRSGCAELSIACIAQA